MNITRGIIAGFLGAVAGVILSVLLVSSYLLMYWYFNDTNELLRRDDITYWREHGATPLVGCAIYLGLAAWVTFTPDRKYSLAKTLAILLISTLSLMFFLNLVHLAPPQPRRMEFYEGFTLTDFFRILILPLLVACVLIFLRRSGSTNSKPENLEVTPSDHAPPE